MDPNRSRMTPAAPAVLLMRMPAGPVAVRRELANEYAVLGVRHIEAACRLLATLRPAVVIASARMPFHDLYVLREHLPAGTVLRLEDPALRPADVARVVRSAHKVTRPARAGGFVPL